MYELHAICTMKDQAPAADVSDNPIVRYRKDLRRLLASMVKVGLPVSHPLWRAAAREWRQPRVPVGDGRVAAVDGENGNYTMALSP